MQECRNADSCAWSRRMACQGQAQVCSNLCPQGIVTELSEPQSHSLTSGVQSSSELKDLTDTSLITQDTATVSESTTEKHMHESLSKRYCSGQIGVPITVLDKYNPEQLEIVKFRKGDDEKDLTYSVDVKCLSKQASKQADDYTLLQNHYPQDTVTVSSECQLPSLINGVQNNSELSISIHTSSLQLQEEKKSQNNYNLETLGKKTHMQEFLSQRYCNGIIGVPITFLDKWNPEQFKIIGFFNNYNPDTAGIGQIYGEAVTVNSTTSLFRGPVINGKAKYFRIIVQKISVIK